MTNAKSRAHPTGSLELNDIFFVGCSQGSLRRNGTDINRGALAKRLLASPPEIQGGTGFCHGATRQAEDFN